MELPGRKDPAACGGVRVERRVRPTNLVEATRAHDTHGFGCGGTRAENQAASPKGKGWSWCAKNVDWMLEANTSMTAWPWAGGR